MTAASRRLVIAAALAFAGCTRTPDPGPVGVTGQPPIQLTVSSVEVQDQVQGLPLNFIDRRRTDAMLAAVKGYLTQHLQAVGGSDFGKAVVEDASLIEQPIPRGGITGAIAGPARELVGSLAVRVAVTDGLGIEKAYARAKVGLKRPVPETSSVVERDRLARDMVNDLLRQLDTALQASIKENLGAYLSTS